MTDRSLTAAHLAAFRCKLEEGERAPATVEKYLRDLRALRHWLGGAPLTKDRVLAWKGALLEKGLAPATVNGKLSALRAFLRVFGWQDLHVKLLHHQRRTFRDAERDLSRDDFLRLVTCAQKRGQKRLALILESLCATGIRVSELSALTVEALRRGRIDIHLKGKIRTILLPARLRRKLEKYVRKQKIASGAIFRTAGDLPISRKQIWAEMKTLARRAGVDPRKVFPHNLRHLFAVVFYQRSKDIVKLADVLGHSSLETTRLYLLTTGQEHERLLDALMLVT